MSYILEALKRSQQAREREQVSRVVPRLHWEQQEAVPLRWSLLAVSVASVALVVALWEKFPQFALVQQETLTTAVSQKQVTVNAAPNTVVSMRPQLEKSHWGTLIAPPPPKLRLAAPVVKAVRQSAPLPLPKKTATPAPPVKHSHSQIKPRQFAPLETDYPNPNFDPKVAQHWETETLPLDDSDIEAPTPIPPDLIQEIEAFKQQVRRDYSAKTSDRDAP